MLIVYGATAGVSVVKLYAGAFFPGLMLAGLYIVYVIVVSKLKPALAPPLSAEARFVKLPALTQRIADTISNRALPALLGALKGGRNAGVPAGYIARQLGVTLLPALVFAAAAGFAYTRATQPVTVNVVADQATALGEPPGGLQEPPAVANGLAEPPGSTSGGLSEPPGSAGLQEPPGATGGLQEPAGAAPASPSSAPATDIQRSSAGSGFWIGLGVGAIALFGFYAMLSFQRLEIFKMLLASFFPLVVLILAVLGSIVFGLATPTEAAAVGAFGGLLLAAAYKQLNITVVKESVFLTAKTSAMVCWLFVGSAIFSAAFALLGGQELVENWVMSMNLSKTQFLVLSQAIIFVLGWPLEWTEIIVIFMPIFIPLLDNFGVDPLFFGLLVALNLQTAFLSPPVAMAAFYLKGVSPPHVTLNQIFAGMMPFMGIQVVAIILLYLFPQIGLWLPGVLYR
jgi:TRAP-type mannitol/chloroaromatic compound transport system permease large subunit